MKIRCVFHNEETASMQIYSDGWAHCFGCGAHIHVDKLPGDYKLREVPPEAEPEDLVAAYEYIDFLPLKKVRGLMLPCDEFSYFITWPEKDYYKRRFFDPGRGPKYVGAKGHTKPWLVANQSGPGPVILVEGEINALSIAAACPEVNVISPGGAGDFYAKKSVSRLLHLANCSKIVLIADRDQAGAKALIEVKGHIDTPERQSKWLLMGDDANEVLEREGKEALRRIIREVLGEPLEEVPGG